LKKQNMDSNAENAGISGPAEQKDRFAEVANTFEWLIIAFILAFIFRAFIMEAFRIPTGSMASTLMGAHFRLRCLRCGYEYDRGFMTDEYGLPTDTLPPEGYAKLKPTMCCNCGYRYPRDRDIVVENGDRILVLKCIYQFFEPKRWDVVVFKNPLQPDINYIKRLIGKPGDSVQIIDGDIYIDGLISRKPEKVQQELWMPIYNNDYQAFSGSEDLPGAEGKWQRPLVFTAGSGWSVEPDDPTRFHLDSAASAVATIRYDTSNGNDFKATYAYNDAGGYAHRPVCSDLKVRFFAERQSAEGGVGAELSKYGVLYRAWADFGGDMAIARVTGETEEVLVRRPTAEIPSGKAMKAEFTNADHVLTFRLAGNSISYDMGLLPDSAGKRTDAEPEVKITAAGRITLSHVAIFRDIYYISGNGVLRAGQEPFKLEANQFFVLGDNSPNSLDSRLWSTAGIGNGGRQFRPGIVPAEYLVGKALVVYWPSGYEFPWPSRFRAWLYEQGTQNTAGRVAYSLAALKWIPNIGRLRLIYGGSGIEENSEILQ
jgi:signal peptidase I